jgi:hypothetical protein
MMAVSVLWLMTVMLMASLLFEVRGFDESSSSLSRFSVVVDIIIIVRRVHRTYVG